MNLRYVLLLTTLLAGFAASLTQGSTLAADAVRPPNVVLLISDDQAWTDYGFMGHKQIETPHLDRLAKESALFTRGYVPSSLCRPSLMTMATGLYPHQHKIAGNDPAGKVNRNLMLKHVQAVATSPRELGQLGYVSLQTGKWWEGAPSLGGFTQAMTHGDTTRGGRHGDVGLKIGREGLKPVFDFIDKAGDDPFYLWYAPFLPHEPHNPPERLLKKYQAQNDSIHIAKYYAMCEWFDETCGQLLDHLDAKGLRENTLVIYVCDNGWIQEPNKRGYTNRSKRSSYDGGVRTPIMVRWPAGQVKAFRDEQTLVDSIDIVPTIREACGVVAKDELPGLSLLSLCRGGQLDRDTIYGEIFAHDQADIDNPSASLISRWCIEKDLKLIDSVDGPPQLFNLADDPFEQQDLAKDQPDTVARLRKKLDAWWTP
ncbi:sulfatase family protein [Lignipirellula cremea]|uniref:Arylsulfatase n=1 Tax=Lignipirellula cremea TaxID=2528010 RepID=A0A518DN98_9BACT|nr:sulfatase [Lignipirellula cremea]QDU93310.1 Arylsulfatase precursor [Lignipirellula cremea]